MFEYIVQPGDNLYRIADYFDVGLQAILLANPGLNPDFLYVGQRIRIPISRNLYQTYPWYYLFPYMFIRYPRRYWNDRRRWPDRFRGYGRSRGDGRGRGQRRGGGAWPIMAGSENPDDLTDLDNVDQYQGPMMGRPYMDQEMDNFPDLDINMQKTDDFPFNP